MAYVKSDIEAMAASATNIESCSKAINDSLAAMKTSISVLEDEKKFCNQIQCNSLMEKFKIVEKVYANYTEILSGLAGALRKIIQNYEETDGAIAKIIDDWNPSEPSENPDEPTPEPDKPERYNPIQDGIQTAQQNFNNYQTAAQQNAANTADYIDRIGDSYGDGFVGQALANASHWFAGAIRTLWRVPKSSAE